MGIATLVQAVSSRLFGAYTLASGLTALAGTVLTFRGTTLSLGIGGMERVGFTRFQSGWRSQASPTSSSKGLSHELLARLLYFAETMLLIASLLTGRVARHYKRRFLTVSGAPPHSAALVHQIVFRSPIKN